jgi:hypothetical protein
VLLASTLRAGNVAGIGQLLPALRPLVAEVASAPAPTRHCLAR